MWLSSFICEIGVVNPCPVICLLSGASCNRGRQLLTAERVHQAHCPTVTEPGTKRQSQAKDSRLPVRPGPSSNGPGLSWPEMLRELNSIGWSQRHLRKSCVHCRHGSLTVSLLLAVPDNNKKRKYALWWGDCCLEH